MFLGYSRLLLLLVSALPALAQTGGPICDLAHVPQPKPHLTFVDSNDEEISAILLKGFADPPKGSEFFTQALELSKTKHDTCGEALAEYGFAAAIDQAKGDQIQQHLKVAVEGFSYLNATHALAQAHYMLGQALRKAEKPSEAAALVLQASREFESSGDREHAVSCKYTAILIERSPDTDKRLHDLAEEAHAIRALGTEGAILHHQGDGEYNAGHYSAALDLYQRARRTLEDCACNNGELATVLVSMGRMERSQGQPEQALKDYAIALRLQQAIGENEYSIQTMNAMAVSYDAIGRQREALALYQKALAQAKAVGAKQFIPFLEGNIGGEYLKMNRFADAARQLQQVIALGGTNYLLCFRNHQLADALLSLNRNQEADAAAETAVVVCRKGTDRDALADALEGRAAVSAALQHYDAAMADVREAMAIREDIRSHLVPDDARKQGYNERIQSLYDTSIDLLTKMGNHREALEVAEQGRARAFLDLMGTQALPAAPGESTVAVDAPTFASYVSAAPYTAAQMIDAARHYNSTILAYWASDKTIYTWVVAADGTIHEARVPVTRTRLVQLIRQTTEEKHSAKPPSTQVSQTSGTAMQSRGPEDVALSSTKSDAWRLLYGLLIAPVDRYLPTKRGALLTIIPHHELFRVSFAALTDSHGQYLVERYAIHSVPASALLRYTQGNEEKAAQLPQHYLLIANPAGLSLKNGLALPALPATLNEVRAIEQLLPVNEVTSLAGSDAQENSVTRALPSATVIHFATHAVMDDADPRSSFLLFYPPPGSKDPVRLTTAAIYQMKLHTRLVVLSACRTGLGRITGDGIDGFSRAFFYAGTASFLSTLWDVADQPTAALLPTFYRELSGGKSRSAALRNAQLALIQKLRTGKVHANTPLGPITLPEDPLYWAAFSLSGEP